MRLTTKYYELDYKDATIRRIKSGNDEMIRMIYGAVRDQNWETLEPEILKEIIVMNEGGFEVDTLVDYKMGEIHFEADIKITGTDTYLSLEIKGMAKSSFETCRVGICVLHPIKECSGKGSQILHADNTSEMISFPNEISPVQCMRNITGIKWEPAKGKQAELKFYGDVFEMEDQRNWTDASYKTYSRPLELPFPFWLEQGDKIHQKVELFFNVPPHFRNDGKTVIFKVDKSKQYKIPELGTCVSTREKPLTTNELSILNELPFDHLRYELKLFEEKWKDGFLKALNESNLTGWPLFLVIYFSDNYSAELNHLESFLFKKKYLVKNILIVGRNHLSDDEIFDKIYEDLKSIFKNALIGSGVNAYFAELNRNRPKALRSEFISFSICPQVHASDNESLIENLEGQKYVVDSAKKFFPQKLIYISPVTLRQRFNIVATTGDEICLPGQLPAQVDIRQRTAFAAQWLMGSIKTLTQSGAALVTFFESVGWRGFIQGDFNPPIPGKFGAQPGEIFPVYYLLKELTGYQKVIYSESSLPSCVEGIVLENDEKKVKLLLTNFSASEQILEINSSIDWKKSKMLFSNTQLKKIGTRIILPPNEIIILIET